MEIKEKAAELRRAYMKDWRKRNKERTRKYTQDYWERKACKFAEGERHDQNNHNIRNHNE